MSISLEDLRAFLSVAKHESFVAAANELSITPPALSRRIKKLEEFVGDQLFDRTTQMVAITSAGRVLRERARVAVREFEDFKRFAETFAHDHYVKVNFASVGSIASAIVPRLIRDYTALHSNAEFEVHDANGEVVNRMVQERRADFGFSTRPLEAENLDFAPLCEDPFVLACPPGHKLFDERRVTWVRLAQESTRKIDWGFLKTSAFGALRSELADAKIPIPSDVKVQHLSTQIGFLESHLKAIVLPVLGASLCRDPDIRVIPITRPPILREIGIVTLPNSHLSRSALSFLDYAKETFVTHYRDLVEPLW